MRALAAGLALTLALPAAAPAEAPDASLHPAPRPAALGVRAATSGQIAPEETPLARAMDHVRASRWSQARAAAAQAGPVAEDVVAWRELRARRGDWRQARDFLARNADWPGLPLLKARAEGLIPPGAPAADVIAYFDDLGPAQAPRTGTGALRLWRALRDAGDAERADAMLVEAWRTLPMSAVQEAAILAAAPGIVAPHHEARLDAMLWADAQAGARRAMDRVDRDAALLARARIALRARASGVDDRVADVPSALRGDPGLAYERFLYRLETGQRARAIELLNEVSTDAEALGRPEVWAEHREGLARRLMREGQGRTAYAVASRHFMDPAEGIDYATLEWLSGYLALRKLDDADAAVAHFEAAAGAVSTPISHARMNYWRGRAYEAQGREADARAAFEESARHRVAFYGQLAAERIDAPALPVLTGAEAEVPLGDLADTTVLQAAEMLLAAGERRLAARFAAHLAESQDADGIRALGQWADRMGSDYLQVAIGKRAASMGIVLPAHYFPVHPLAEAEMSVEPALALAVARRESEFHPGVASGVGAQGLMQLMPATAQEVAGELRLPYRKAWLTSRPDFNVALGTKYLQNLEDRFGMNAAMIAAGYNAGPSRPARWARERGDPRRMDVDAAVDWVEHIPFEETRVYVMRVLESVPMYRQRLSGEAAKTEIGTLLTGR